MPTRDTLRIAAVSDVHYAKTSQGSLQPLFAQIAEQADVLVLPGDLTDYGYADEARILAHDLKTTVKIPIVAVLGNHDYEAGEPDEVRRILADAGVHMLDGDAVEIHGVDSLASRDSRGDSAEGRSARGVSR